MSASNLIKKGQKFLGIETNKKKKKKPKLYLRWTTYFLLAMVFFVILFAWSEKDIETKQPSNDWSMGVEILKGLPADYRLIDQTELPDGTGFALSTIDEIGIQIYTFDWFGKQVASNTLPLDTKNLKVVELTKSEDNLYLYYSDRVTLNRIKIDVATLSFAETIEISRHAEQFAASGLNVVTGDDILTEFILDTTLKASFSDYDNVQKICMVADADRMIATMNTVEGGKVVFLENDVLNVKPISTSAEQKSYGYFKDIHLENGVLTLVSSKFNHLAPNSPTVISVLQLDAVTYNEISFELFYHVRTSLDPVITKVDGKKVSYILGTQQTVDTVNKGLSRYPQTRGGLFTNVSHFTRENDILIENTRLTLTRRYPVGYQVFHAPFGDVLTWADKVEGKTVMTMAGQGEAWIDYAKSQYDTNYIVLLSAAFMAYGNMVFFGIISLIRSLTPFMRWIVGAVVIAALYNRFMPIDKNKCGKHILFAGIAFVVVVKLIMVASPTSDFRFYAHIYPWLFGNTTMLVSVSVMTSALSIGMLYLWKKQHYYYTNKLLQFSVFFGIELTLFMLSTMAFFVSAMMKNNFRL